MKTYHLTLLGLFLTSQLMGQTPAAKPPLFSNGDFSKGFTADQLWDGVGSTGGLRVLTSEQQIATQSGVISSVPMPASPCLADVTGDGLLDLLVGDPQGYIWVYKNFGSKEQPKWTHGEILPVWLYNYAKWGQSGDRYNPKISVSDWNGDNAPDVLVGTIYGEVFAVPLSNSGGLLRVPQKQLDRLEVKLNKDGFYWGNLFAPLHFDWNKDFKKDLILGEGTYSANSVWILLNEGSANSPLYNSDNRKPLVYGDGREQLIPVIVDWDNDGNQDLLVADYKGTIQVYPNTKGSTDIKEALPSPEPPILVKVGSSTSFGSLANPAAGDINGDGLFDLVIGRTSGAIQLCLNSGKPGTPEFKAATDIPGVDVYPKYKKPSAWDVTVAAGKPYYLLEQVNDPSNTPSLPDRSGGDCLKFSFFEPKNEWTDRDFPENINPDSLHSLTYSGRIPLKGGRNYAITFYSKSSGWSDATVEMTGQEVGGKTVATKNRRGEVTGFTGTQGPPPIKEKEKISSGGWKQYSISLKVKTSKPDATMDFDFRVSFKGQGEFFMDDIKIVEK